MNDTEIAMMIIFSAIGIGAVVTGLIYLGVKLYESGKRFMAGISGLASLADQNRKLAEVGMMVVTELQMLRSVISHQDPNVEQSTYQTPPTPRPVAGVPFPATPPWMYAAPGPDAKEEDSSVDDTDDAKMAEMEALEKLREQGFDAE